MKMKEEPRQFSQTDDEETLVAPRFDEEETIIARAVVPLEGAATYARRARALRRPWPLALVIVSVLIGSVLGGAGLYLYQSRRHADAPAPEPVSVAAQPAPAPTAEAQSETTGADAGESATDTHAVETPNDESSAKKEEADGKRESEALSVPEHHKVSDETERGGAPKHGKKGEGDDYRAAQDEQRPRRVEQDTQAPIPDDSSPAAQRARRVEDALRRADRARERRRQRRENAARSPDSIRSIFEGQPR